MRSPIEQMVDRACGITEADLMKRPQRRQQRQHNQKQIDRDAEVLLSVADSAVIWWRSKRPEGWTEEQHLKSPTVNCFSVPELKLAKNIRHWIKLGG